MHDHPDAWPFKEPVDARDVPDYYVIIKDPIGIILISQLKWIASLSKEVEQIIFFLKC